MVYVKRLVTGVLVAAMALCPLGGGVAYASPLPATDMGRIMQTLTNLKSDEDVADRANDTEQTATVQGFTLDSQTVKGGEVLEASNNWLHFQSVAANGNSPTDKSQYPAVAVNEGTFDFTQAGEYHAIVKSPQEGTKNRFGFYLGYKNPNSGLFLGFDATGWFWQRYGGDGNYASGGIAAPAVNAETKIDITWDGAKATVTVDGDKSFDVDYSTMLGVMSDKLAMKAGSWASTSDITNVYLKDPSVPETKYTLSGRVVDSNNQPISGAKVRIAGQPTVTTKADGTYGFADLTAGEYTVTISARGYQDASKTVTIADANLPMGDVSLTRAQALDTDTISSKAMDVAINKHFPTVAQYTMKQLENRVMYGQSKDVRTVSINGTNIDLADGDVTLKKDGDSKAIYTLKVANAAKNINAELTVEMKVDANTLDFNVTKITNKAGEEHPVQTVAFPNHSLVSVNSDEDGAQFTGARMSSDTNKVGDTSFDVTESTTIKDNGDYTYGFISGDSLSAGLWSNSEHDGTTASGTVAGGARNTRVVASTQSVDGSTSLGLASAPWYYQRTVSDSKKNSYTVKETDMPKMSVAITGDENKDNTVDWQDGALAYRSIMNNPYKSEEVPELVSWRIAMNFGSQAQNPFLTTLDNVKKVALNTDGLGQSVLLKGYGNEGHDSGHPDYGDIGERIGGAEDMNTMMEQGKQYGARFGVHVNASEMYPEAKAFSENMVRRNASGGLSYGWNWLDQAVGIDGVYDLASGSRNSRFQELSDEVGDNMDFIYLDVWGNNTSGAEDSWETRKMSQMINDKGWRMTTEWGAGNEYDATFQHWAADLTYGGSGMKGENSQIMRFLRNHQKDSWVGDYPSYGGAANAPLLGGYNMKDFEGWQGRNDYDAYINNLYTHDVSTKFIQHFKVSRWVNSPLDATSVQDPNTNNGNEYIELKDDNGNVVTLARGSNDQANAAYRNRTITLNGKTVSDGAVSKGDGTAKGSESYLLPWLWNSESGKLVADKDQKLYHWNTAGGQTTWTLPKGWENLANVKVYKLTDLGKADEQTVAVSGGKVSLDADAETPYVVYKGDAAPKQLSITWSEGMHLIDAGFNGGEQTFEKDWSLKGNGKASIAKSQYSNPMLKLNGEVSATQKLTDMKPGSRYALFVGVDNRSDADATMTVNGGGKVLASNASDRSIAKNYIKAYSHNTNSATVDGTSYFQNMYVFFTVPDSGEVTLTLAHEGEGDVYFDDVRVVENGYKGITTDANGEVTALSNDFENNAQGVWPFVVSGSEGVEDNRVHLSELHAPYTQAGWDVKKMDDVLDGDWSVKINGLTQKNTLVYQTVPQNFKFEAGEKYKVSFDYQSGSDGTYDVAVGQGEFSSSNAQLTELAKALGTDGHHEFELTGGLNGDSWFGIYSTAKAPDVQGVSGSEADFGGYKDFVLDNLKIERVDSEAKTKAEAEAKLDEISKKYDGKQSSFSDEAWAIYQNALDDIRVLINKNGASSADFTKAYGLLNALDEYMQTAPNNDGSDKFDVAGDQYAASAGSAQAQSGNEGPVEFAQDGLADTHWHSGWSENAVANGTAWYQFDLAAPTTINGLRYLPRSGGDNSNGKIKKYSIDLTLADGSVNHIVTEGVFSTATKWQKVSFGAVENVKTVRITAIETAGQSTAQENKFVSAAELRLTTNRDVPPTPTVIDKSALTALLDEVAKLKESGYTADSWKALQTQVTKANTVVKDQNATRYDVELATANLRDAIKGLVVVTPDPQPGKVDKTALEAAIAKAQALDLSSYTNASAKAVREALTKAQSVLADKNATQSQVNDAAKALQSALDGLKHQGATPNKPGVKPGETGDGDTPLTNTGSSVVLIGVVALLAAAGGVVIISRRRRD
jgi:endo-alpha-N-acetylgalactosaminidase